MVNRRSGSNRSIMLVDVMVASLKTNALEGALAKNPIQIAAEARPPQNLSSRTGITSLRPFQERNIENNPSCEQTDESRSLTS